MQLIFNVLILGPATLLNLLVLILFLVEYTSYLQRNSRVTFKALNGY